MKSSKKEIRKKFRNDVFKRDGKCMICGKLYSPNEDDMDAHHITDRSEMPNGGYVKENGITLCKDAPGYITNEEYIYPGYHPKLSCHMMAEQFHISGGKEWIEGYHPDDLYKMIGSSKELAIEKSKKL